MRVEPPTRIISLIFSRESLALASVRGPTLDFIEVGRHAQHRPVDGRKKMPFRNPLELADDQRGDVLRPKLIAAEERSLIAAHVAFDGEDGAFLTVPHSLLRSAAARRVFGRLRLFSGGFPPPANS